MVPKLDLLWYLVSHDIVRTDTIKGCEMAPSKRTGVVQVKLRISDDLKRRLDREAKKREDGSLSAEIAKRLEDSFANPLQDLQNEAIATSVVQKLIVSGFVPPKKV